jgi:hypothetical protein
MTSDKRQQAVVCLLKIEFRFRYDPFNTDLFSSPFNCPLKWKKPGKLDGLVTAVDDVSVPGKYQAGPLSKSLGEKFPDPRRLGNFRKFIILGPTLAQQKT